MLSCSLKLGKTCKFGGAMRNKLVTSVLLVFVLTTNIATSSQISSNAEVNQTGVIGKNTTPVATDVSLPLAVNTTAGMSSAVSTQISAPVNIPDPKAEIAVPNTLLVKIETPQDDSSYSFNSVSSFAKGLAGVQQVEAINASQDLLLLTHDDSVSSESLQKKLTQSAGIKYAEPDYIYHTQLTPNDPMYSELWGLNTTLPTDVDIDAPEAWDYVTGSEDVVVGVIDTGIDYTHTDLRNNVWTNPNEIAGNGIDDDNNGWVDDIHGIDTVNNDADPRDDHYHGTHVSGTIAAEGNNGIGITGVNWRAKIISCKFLDYFGSGTSSAAVRCLEYFAALKRAGVNIVLTNNSWGGGLRSQALEDAISEHEDLGIIFVAAAGNSSRNIDLSPDYPAAYPNENIVSVAALKSDGRLASFSNYGITRVDLAAPGDSILSTSPSNGYRFLSGTSMAAPHVAGVLALQKAASPNLEADELIQNLYSNVELVPALETLVATRGTAKAFILPDDDVDGMPNDWETEHGLDPNDPADAPLDGDGDGLTNLEEFIAGSDPNDTDTDDDGLSDSDEVRVHGTDPASNDSDDDGLLDPRELELNTDPNDADTDDDGLSDFEEVNEYETDPLNSDSDGDGYSDWEEAIQYESDPNDADSRPQPLEYYTESFEDGLPAGWSAGAGSSAPWFIDTTESFTGQQSIRAGSIGRSQNSSIEWTGLFGSGTFTFHALVDAEYCCDYLQVYVDGQYQFRISRNSAWRQYSFQLSGGTHTIRFQYRKDGSVDSGRDTVWIDQIIFMQDSDFDGMADQWELEHGLDPNNPADAGLDPDEDDLTNLEEFINGADPHDSDSDDDSMPDGWEVRYRLNPADATDAEEDLDGDTLINVREFELGTAPDNTDTDSDLLLDNEELELGADPLNPDTDGDGFVDGFEYHIFSTNPLQAWSRPSSLRNSVVGFEDEELPSNWGRFFDNRPLATWERTTDVARTGNASLKSSVNDASIIELVGWFEAGELEFWVRYDSGSSSYIRLYIDGASYYVSTSYRNWRQNRIPLEAGFHQIRWETVRGEFYLDDVSFKATDIDADTIADSWELRNGLSTDTVWDAIADFDDDGLTNIDEYDYDTDPNNEDTDADGIADGIEIVWELNPLNPNDAAADQDNDGLSAAQEAELGTDPFNPDSDGDGVIDGEEVGLGTNPLNEDSDGDTLTDFEELELDLNPLSADTDDDGLNDDDEISRGTDPRVADTDNDGLFDGREIELGTNPLVEDTDADGLTDNEELVFRTDPTRLDSDGDGLNDGDEISRSTNPLRIDTDGDQLTDAQEVALGLNPLQVDTDLDNLSDFAEVSGPTDPLNPDTDGDSLVDGQELLIGTDPLLADTDADGLSDAQELALNTDPTRPDSDNDGLNDGDEVSRSTDPLRQDTDGDQLDDAQEVALGLNPLMSDSDSDGLSDAEEVSGPTDPLNPDSDNDGLTDGEERRLGTDPLLADTDDDGLSDSQEVNLLTDPLRADTDLDGISDLEEVELSSNPLSADTDRDGLIDGIDDQIFVDSNPPVVIPPADINVNASGLLTDVALGLGAADDVLDGNLPVTTDQVGPFSPGVNSVVWQATDSAGNTGYAVQTVNVVPLVEFSLEQVVAEGTEVSVTAQLNGSAVEYPVVVEFELSGDAEFGTDHDLEVTEIIIEEGDLSGVARFNIVKDELGEFDETLVLTMFSAENAVMGDQQTHTVSIIEQNLAPIVDIQLYQNGEPITVIVVDAGLVTVTGAVNDPNPQDEHGFDWSASDNALSLVNATVKETSFDPVSLVAGVYQLALEVDELNRPQSDSVSYSRFYPVVYAQPELKANVDSDQDGVMDEDEGISDSDGDGLLDYKDAYELDYVLGMVERDPIIITEVGRKLLLADVGVVDSEVMVSSQAVADFYGAYLGAGAVEEPEMVSATIYNLKVADLVEVGGSAQIVVALDDEIATSPVFQAFTLSNGWQAFVQDEQQILRSSVSVMDTCTSPSATFYSQEVTAGDHCLYAVISDGGENDLDGAANGVITLVLGVGAEIPEVEEDQEDADTANRAASGSGSSSGSGSFPVWVILLLGVGAIFRNYFTSTYFRK